MWYEARKREKATQKLFDDHRKRAEKRREENRIDPHSLLQVNGIKSKLCLDPTVYKQATKSLVAWQGDKNVSIDRFDVRTTLTTIPHEKQPVGKSVLDINESESIKSVLNYERYRLLIKNDVNKTPESLRLQLIAQSQVLTGSQLKKMQYDSFGAYSEFVSKQQQQQQQQQQHHQFRPTIRGKDCGTKRDQRPTGVAGYSAVPPPEHLAAKTTESGQVPDKNQDQTPFSVVSVIDLDEIEDGDDLDAINPDMYEDNKTIDDIVHKYGLSAQEFFLLARRDKDELTLTGLVKELDDLKNKIKLSIEKQNDQVYGPILPLDLQLQSGSPDSPSSSSGDDEDTHCQQRSPSGAIIPSRDDAKQIRSPVYENNLQLTQNSPPASPPACKEIQKEPTRKESDESPAIHQSCTRRSRSRIHSDNSSSQSPIHSRARESRKRKHSSAHRAQTSDSSLPPRRASTPLAYKRHQRSSRSLSRERRASSNSSHHRHHRRHRRESSRSSRRRKHHRRSSSSSSSSSSSR